MSMSRVTRGASSRWTGRRRPSLRTTVTMLDRLQFGQPWPQLLCAIVASGLDDDGDLAGVVFADAVVLARGGRVVDVGVVRLDVPRRGGLVLRHSSGHSP